MRSGELAHESHLLGQSSYRVQLGWIKEGMLVWRGSNPRILHEFASLGLLSLSDMYLLTN